jgi:SWI/SNF-related matrix-associated actin-dependent regulator of chromatin subfamily A member 5
LFSTL